MGKIRACCKTTKQNQHGITIGKCAALSELIDVLSDIVYVMFELAFLFIQNKKIYIEKQKPKYKDQLS